MNRIRNMFAMLLTLAAAACAQAAPEEIMGDYKGTFTQSATPSQSMPCEAKVVAQHNGNYRLLLEAKDPAGKAEPVSLELYARERGGTVEINGWAAGQKWEGGIAGEKMNGHCGYDTTFALEREKRTSPTVGTPPPPGAIVLIPFKEGTPPDMSEWANKEWVPQADGSVLVKKGDNITNRDLGDIKLHVEFKVPLVEDAFGQGRGNSGVILCRAYEIQVLDSFGLYSTSGDCGGIYGLARPNVNAALPPGEWQAYDIEFRAARLNADGSVKELPRFVSVVWNGVKIHDNVELPTPTGAPKNPHMGPGPLMLQDHGNPVQYRNVWAVELK